MYPPQLVEPMKAELMNAGFKEFVTAEEVDNHIKNHQGTTLIVINSVCGCAARTCRPAVLHSLQVGKNTPDHLTTVFAGFDEEAVAKVREHSLPYPPSSPSIVFFKDGELTHMVERHQIEGQSEQMLSNFLQEVYKEFC